VPGRIEFGRPALRPSLPEAQAAANPQKRRPQRTRAHHRRQPGRPRASPGGAASLTSAPEAPGRFHAPHRASRALPNALPGRSYGGVSTLGSVRTPCARSAHAARYASTAEGARVRPPPVTRPHLAVPGWPLTPIEVGRGEPNRLRPTPVLPLSSAPRAPGHRMPRACQQALWFYLFTMWTIRVRCLETARGGPDRDR